MDFRLIRSNRRDFLHWASLMTGAAIAAPAAHAAPYAPRARVGLLLPGNAASDQRPYASAAVRYERGLRAGFSAARRPLDLLTAAGCDTPTQAAHTARAFLDDGVQLVIWLSDSPVNAGLRELFAEYGAVLLMSGAGANLPRQSDDSPFIYYHSLGLWQSAWALGSWAAGKLGKRAFLLSSLYDAGFDTLFALQMGFESAGGELLNRAVTGLVAGDLQPALQRAAQSGADFIAAFYQGEEAAAFLRAYAQSGLKLPLVGPGFLTETDAPASLPAVYSALGWGSGISTAAAWAFNSALPRLGGGEPSALSLLGYEAAGLLDAALSKVETGAASRLNAALDGLRFSGPRGEVICVPGSGIFCAPVYLRQLRAGANGSENAVLNALQGPSLSDERVLALRAGQKTGWTQPYLRL